MLPMWITIETPKGSRIKFNYDPESSCYKLKKMLPAGMEFPFDFGFIPGTRGGDGDPLDIISVAEFPTFAGCIVECRIIGAIVAEQTESGGTPVRNDRFLGVPLASEQFHDIQEISQLPSKLITDLQHFFSNYNAAENKGFRVLEVVGSQAAAILIKKRQEKEGSN
jgi:inorganic pyrophosphatase